MEETGVMVLASTSSVPPSSGLDKKVTETDVLEAAQERDRAQYPIGVRLVAVIVALALCVFLMPLDTVRTPP